MTHRPSATSVFEALGHAFALLARVELAHDIEWDGPTDADALRVRVEVLALLLNVIPRSHLHRLDEVVLDWNTYFSGQHEVTIAALRGRTRTILKQPSIDPNEESSPAATMRRLEVLLGTDVSGQDTGAVRQFTNDVKRRCTFYLFTWASRVDQWKHLPNVVPGGSPTPIEDTYVDLYARPQTSNAGIGATGGRSLAMRGHESLPMVGIGAMVARTLEHCVVIGEPGSGKSTLVHWLAWATRHHTLRDFDVALVVRLRDYAASLSEHRNQSLVEYFFESLNTRLPDFKDEADFLRQVAAKNKRFLLLLDGWDEVPSAQRDEIREAIQFESPFFVVLVTSRASGSPWQLFPSDRADYYQIAGLTPPAIRSFVEKQLRVWGEADRTEDIVRKIERDPDLWGMSANPFLLGLVVRVLSLGSTGDRTLTLHQLFQEISNWIVEHHQRAVPASDQLLGEDLQALERLSYHLMFDQESPQYVFRRQQLNETLIHRRIDPLNQSRFINRLDPMSDNWSFLHATFEEYFTAKYLTSLDEPKLNVDWDRAFCSQSRLVALSFFAGQRGPTSTVSKERADYWLKNLDRFGLVLARLAQVAGAGRWCDCFPELTKRIEDQLWAWITTASDWRCSRMLLEAFARFNPSELVRRAGSTRKIDLRILETICELLPAEFIKDRELFDVLPASLRDTVTVRQRETKSTEEINLLVSQIGDRSSSPGELIKALNNASVISDAAIASALLERLFIEPNEHISTLITMSLSPIFNRLPQSIVLNLLTEPIPVSSTVRRLASAALGHSAGDGEQLDPNGRDRLLRRLCVLPPEDVRVEPILIALRGFPIRDGGALIGRLALDHTLGADVRNVAIDVLRTVSDLSALQRVASCIPAETSDVIRPHLCQLAVQRDVVVPRRWLESAIATESNSWHRRTLFAVYVRMFVTAAADETREFRNFLSGRIQKAMKAETPDDDNSSFEIASAINSFGRSSEKLARQEFLEAATGLARRLAAGAGNVSAGQVHLAIALLRANQTDPATRLLEQMMAVLMRKFGSTRDKRLRIETEAQIMAACEALAELNVGCLLTCDPNFEPVKAVLTRLSLDSGWLIFADRILNTDGREVATLKPPTPTGEDVSEASIYGLLSELGSDVLKSAVQSRWIAVSVCRVCDASATDKEIHAAIDRIREGHEGDVAAEAMHTLYPTGVPNLHAWRQAVTRAVRKLKLLPGGLEYLKMQGLPKQG